MFAIQAVFASRQVTMSESPERSVSSCLCGLCAECITDPNECVCAGGQAFHLDCYGANRKLERSFQKQPDAADMRKWRKENPQEYRFKALELCMSQRDVDGKVQRARRGIAETQKVGQILSEVRTFSLMTKKRRVFLLGQKAFVAWYHREEEMSKEEAEAKWIADRANKKRFQAQRVRRAEDSCERTHNHRACDWHRGVADNWTSQCPRAT